MLSSEAKLISATPARPLKRHTDFDGRLAPESLDICVKLKVIPCRKPIKRIGVRLLLEWPFIAVELKGGTWGRLDAAAGILLLDLSPGEVVGAAFVPLDTEVWTSHAP
jgi:hypothetical protein